MMNMKINETVPPDIVYGDETSKDLSVSEGENVTLNCQATGTPKPRVSWKREDGQHILIRNSTSFSSSYSTYLLSTQHEISRNYDSQKSYATRTTNSNPKAFMMSDFYIHVYIYTLSVHKLKVLLLPSCLILSYFQQPTIIYDCMTVQCSVTATVDQ